MGGSGMGNGAEWGVMFQGTGTASEIDIDTRRKKGPGGQILKQMPQEGGAQHNPHPLCPVKITRPALEHLSCLPQLSSLIWNIVPPRGESHRTPVQWSQSIFFRQQLFSKLAALARRCLLPQTLVHSRWNRLVQYNTPFFYELDMWHFRWIFWEIKVLTWCHLILKMTEVTNWEPTTLATFWRIIIYAFGTKHIKRSDSLD